MQKQPASLHLAIPAQVVWIGTFALFLVGMLFLGYSRLASDAITIFGFITTLHVIMQIVFAALNRRKMHRIKEYAERAGFAPPTSLMSVGYREDLTLLRNHFLSIRSLNSMLNTYVFVSGGNEGPEDWAMPTVFREVFPDGLVVVHLPFVLVEATDTQKNWLSTGIRSCNTSSLCLLQPHRVKHAMYTAMQLVCTCTNTDILVTTDSDAVLDPEAVRQLTLPFHDPRIGVVTGDVHIFNAVNWLRGLSSVRYWFAFNLERSAQSFWGS